jgi:TPR repeat protein
MMTCTKIFKRWFGYAISILMINFSLGCKMQNHSVETLPRNQNLPLFEPHMPTFDCKVEASFVPVIDAEAHAWFMEARAMESPEVFMAQRDYAKIVQLTRQAAERHHWKAMLNLASLYIEKRDPPHGVEEAVKIVEQAMQMGIPAAYDRMGTFHLNGTGVRADVSRAYAFFQKAAQMGNPNAMTFLAEKLRAGSDGIIPGYWDNIPISTKMLECALGQGYGPAAEYLHNFYKVPRSSDGTVIGEPTAETKSRAVQVLQQGVRLGCQQCATSLATEFEAWLGVKEMLAPHVDMARSERYYVLSEELSFNPSARFPNLDKVVPLPPADLPPWNGDRDTLLAAAMGVTLPLTPAKTMMVSNRIEQPHPDMHYKLRASGEQTVAEHASFPGYWQPVPLHHDEPACQVLERTPARPYRAGEPFATLFLQTEGMQKPIENVLWRHFHTLRHNHGAVEPMAVPGLSRVVPHRNTMLMAKSEQMCPATGTWQPWIDVTHPMQAIVNQPWRQAWLHEGATFPQPETDWLLPLPATDITWYLLDDTGVDLG